MGRSDDGLDGAVGGAGRGDVGELLAPFQGAGAVCGLTPGYHPGLPSCSPSGGLEARGASGVQTIGGPERGGAEFLERRLCSTATR